ncbi:hypothetical protein B0I35DRAFT_20218 [Stachybotrys elegans]|uniref:Uncharacterized protein n=1 Tax=Stachybotrys elegans TaxID=80388 RepID=A0A8K0T0Z8_9HYPO|nr:hypothetical protein B0I35DRAFT_20218 [Stachybotrys elegans]
MGNELHSSEALRAYFLLFILFFFFFFFSLNGLYSDYVHACISFFFLLDLYFPSFSHISWAGSSGSGRGNGGIIGGACIWEGKRGAFACSNKGHAIWGNLL